MRRPLQLACLATAVVLATASSPRQVQYTPASNKQYPAKPVTCQLAVLSAPPQQAYEELGTFDVTREGDAEATLDTAGALRDALAARTCELGGDALLVFVVGNPPRYKRATVLRWVEAAPPAPQLFGDSPPIEAAPIP